MQTRVEWVADRDGLTEVAGQIGRGPVALDTEADSFHHYRERVCLIQLSFAGRDVLIDPLGGLGLEPLAPMLGDASVRKIVHGADYDLRVLDRDYGLRIRGLFDTMVAARFVGHRSFGLAALLEHYEHVTLDKRHRLADWTQRPLPGDLLDYATRDTRYLASLAGHLESRLSRLGRTAWAQEEFRRLEDVRWSHSASGSEAFRGVRGSRGLSARELAVLERLYAWRDEQARTLDRPPTRLISDRLLVVLSRTTPTNVDALKKIGLGGRWRRPREARRLLSEIERTSERPPECWPRPTTAEPRRRRVDNQDLVTRLRAARDAAARRLELEPSVVATRRLLEAIAERLDAGDDWRDLPELRTWQRGEIEGWLAENG